jgi:hypothetical protein
MALTDEDVRIVQDSLPAIRGASRAGSLNFY